MTVSAGAPAAVLFLQRFFSLGRYQRVFYQGCTLFLTFIAYTAFHMSRRPLAVVKNSLNRDCSRLTPPPGLIITENNKFNWCDWPPFDGKDANRLLGVLDSVYVFAYAVCMFMSGMIAERIDLRYYLSLGMLLSGLFTYLFGIAYYLDIHSFTFFVVVQIFAGAVQCTGWPGVVACVGNWFGKGRRGLIFGIWNAHLYAGNILGAYVAGYFVAENWGLSFIVPGAIVGGIGFILFLFLVPYPEDVNCAPENTTDNTHDYNIRNLKKCPPSDSMSIYSNTDSLSEKTPLSVTTTVSTSDQSEHGRKQAITFWKAVKIPGVIEFSLCLFFSKLVSYTFLFWLPRYLDHTTGIGSQQSAYLSIVFDVGGILGGVIAGTISDQTGTSAVTCVGFLGLAIPMLLIFQAYGSACATANILLQLVCGALVNGPYALITTAVSAELGTHESIQKNSKALSTVTAIIDGTGSVGAAIGPLLAGMISEISWAYVFYMMMFADFCALVALLRTAFNELRKKKFSDNRYVLPINIRCCRRKHNQTYQRIG